MKIDIYTFKYVNIISGYCIQYWNITREKMGKLVAKYKLAEFINENMDGLDPYGPRSLADIIREEIERQGGNVYEQL